MIKATYPVGSRTKSGRYRTAKAVRYNVRSKIKKENIRRGLVGQKSLSRTATREIYQKNKVHTFPGKIKNSDSGYPDGPPGRFVQSFKGSKGKEFIESGIKLGMDAYLASTITDNK